VRVRTLVLVLAMPMALTAQTPAPAPLPAPGEGFTYDAEGRRDPFLNLLASGASSNLAAQRPEGAAGLATAELSVRGVVSSRGALVAMVQGPDNRTYLVHQGDKLADGVIKTVTPQGLVVMQDINDPLSTQKQREVRKLLRSLEDTKE
jgi:Tfp pilus assembly protein PilP